MANNRLYVGNRRDKEYVFLEKGWGCGWTGGWVNDSWKNLRRLIREAYSEGGVYTDTDLFFFTEQSPCYEEIMRDWDKIESKESNPVLLEDLE